MIIEKFIPGKEKELYKRFDEKGRLMPDRLNYISSWIDEHITTCFQIMETESIGNIYEWISHWDDLADFEIIPVISTQQAKEKLLGS